MKKLNFLAAALMLGTLGVNAGHIFVIGDATLYGWNTDAAQALLSDPENDDVYTGTLYLKGGQDFKFLTVPDWGGTEYGAADGASLTDGKVDLASGTDDNGYAKLQVSEDANYLITVNTADLTASVVKSDYQAGQVTYSSLFMVGSATQGQWSVDEGTPMYQNPSAPCEFSASKVELLAGTFKIATALKGGGTWNGEYWYFRNSGDASLMALNQEGDEQWQIETPGKYNVTANTATGSISIKPDTSSTSIAIEADSNAPAEYFTLQGVRVENPAAGLYIVRQGSRVSKTWVK